MKLITNLNFVTICSLSPPGVIRTISRIVARDVEPDAFTWTKVSDSKKEDYYAELPV